MKIVFLSNFFNYHQKALSDALYNQTDGNYIFVATEEMSSDRKQMGWSEAIMPSYVVEYFNSNRSEKDEVDKMIDDSDVAIIGSAPYQMIEHRLKSGRLVYFYSERPLKSQVRLHSLCHLAIDHWFKWGRYKNAFLLAASAYSYPDYIKLLSFRNRAFKWGYFPKVKCYDNLNEIFELKREKLRLKHLDVSILWVARLIGLKHPESTIEVAELLNSKGIRYELNIIGTGPLENRLKMLIDKKGLSSTVHVLGPMPPEKVRHYMEASDVFLFTSDRNEGWGAVLNESMNSACAVVASNEIGSVPFLIDDNRNGLIFRDQHWDDLCDKILWLINNPEEKKEIQRQAYYSIVDLWNADNAAKRLLEISNAIMNNEQIAVEKGPCSKAEYKI